jgi:hypothetical protein
MSQDFDPNYQPSFDFVDIESCEEEPALPPFSVAAVKAINESKTVTFAEDLTKYDRPDFPAPTAPKKKRGRPAKKAPVVPNESVQNELIDKLNEQIARDEAAAREKVEMEKASAPLLHQFDKHMKEQRGKDKARDMGVDLNLHPEMALDPEEYAIKTKLLQQIEMRYDFDTSGLLRDSCPRKTKWTYKCSIADLQNELRRCEQKRNISHALESMKSMDLLLNYAAELFLCKTGTPAQGLAAAAKESQDIIEEELQEMSIKYCDWFDFNPETRYLISSIKRIAAVVMQNRKRLEAQARSAATGPTTFPTNPLNDLQAKFNSL